MEHVVVSCEYGEPLLNSATRLFIKLVKNGPGEQYLGVHTNGTMVDKELVAVLTSDNRPGDYVNIHLSAPPSRPDLYRAVQGGTSAQQKRTVAAIQRIAARKMQRGSKLTLRVNAVLTPVNYPTVTNLERLVAELGECGAGEIRLVPAVPQIGITRGDMSFISAGKMREIEAAKGHLQGFSSARVVIHPQKAPQERHNSFGQCHVKDSALVISPDGSFAPCCLTTFPQFPFRISGKGKLTRIVSVLGEMRAISFVPSKVCPPCSKTDYAENLRENQQLVR
jgi:MoaA/NifB/PqqE/SkfB family radical SAM enzyme